MDFADIYELNLESTIVERALLVNDSYPYFSPIVEIELKEVIYSKDKVYISVIESAFDWWILAVSLCSLSLLYLVWAIYNSKEIENTNTELEAFCNDLNDGDQLRILINSLRTLENNIQLCELSINDVNNICIYKPIDWDSFSIRFRKYSKQVKSIWSLLHFKTLIYNDLMQLCVKCLIRSDSSSPPIDPSVMSTTTTGMDKATVLSKIVVQTPRICALHRGIYIILVSIVIFYRCVNRYCSVSIVIWGNISECSVRISGDYANIQPCHSVGY